MKRIFTFFLIAMLLCPFSALAQEMTFFAGQTENTFNYHFGLGGDLNDYNVDLDADGVNDLHFEMEVSWIILKSLNRWRRRSLSYLLLR